jgi:hypothetical protein
MAAMTAEEIYALPDLDPAMEAMHRRQCYFEYHIAHTPTFYWPPDVAEFYKVRNDSNSKFMKYVKEGTDEQNKAWIASHSKVLKMLQE